MTDLNIIKNLVEFMATYDLAGLDDYQLFAAAKEIAEIKGIPLSRNKAEIYDIVDTYNQIYRNA